jgi:arginyl-tRNA synthetase
VEYGESFYHEMLPGVVQKLRDQDLATDSEGAVCVFLDDFDTPMIVQKSDGAFLYSTTDLATIEYRVAQWQPDEILYVVDHRQSEHFQKLFAVAQSWIAGSVQLRHISFGTVLDEHGRPYKTRSGSAVGLEGLLDEAVAKALEIVSTDSGDGNSEYALTTQQCEEIADAVGHGAIKYADLAHNRTSDYVFSYDKMMALEGNTATYMQYCYARVQSIFRKGEIDLEQIRATTDSINLDHSAERLLALTLVRYAEALDEVLEDYRPNQLTNYLFDLAKRFSSFFEQCPVLKAEDDAIKLSRLRLCDLTARTIAHGLDLLGIDVVQQM